MDKIRIVNWLLTRRCNLKCDYCGIVKDHIHKPGSYPYISEYIKNEMDTQTVIDGLLAFKKHNPQCFHILYGGEPLLRKDLSKIINFCNENNIQYTIISNNTPEIQPLIKKLFDETEYIQGFTSSVDPMFNETDVSNDRVRKSIEGFRRLKEIQQKGKVKDVVAEITVMKHNQHLLHKLVTELSKDEIYSDITFVDNKKNAYYDFSNVVGSDFLVKPTFELAEILAEIKKDNKLFIHMKDVLIPQMFNTLPSNFDCEIEKNLHNLTIDADGTIRLCLRIRGTVTPKMYTIKDLFKNGFEKDLKFSMKIDKKRLCQLCNHSCLMMSKYINESETGEGELIHSDKRRVEEEWLK